MTETLVLSDAAMRVAGILLLSVVAIEWGGTFMLRVVRGGVPLTDFQRSFSRAGHAHAGVLVILALVCVLYADAAAQDGLWGWLARSGVMLLPSSESLEELLEPAGLDGTPYDSLPTVDIEVRQVLDASSLLPRMTTISSRGNL